jgi:hypothetical protein
MANTKPESWIANVFYSVVSTSWFRQAQPAAPLPAAPEPVEGVEGNVRYHSSNLINSSKARIVFQSKIQKRTDDECLALHNLQSSRHSRLHDDYEVQSYAERNPFDGELSMKCTSWLVCKARGFCSRTRSIS